MSFTLILWLFTLGVLLHNLEEALWLPAWAEQHQTRPKVSAFGFRFATVIVSCMFVVVAVFATLAEPGSAALYAATGLMGVMVLNALFPHIALTVYKNTYMPGLFSAILMVLPLGLLGIWRAVQFDLVEPKLLSLVVLALILLAVPVLLGLFKLGDRLRSLLR